MKPLHLNQNSKIEIKNFKWREKYDLPWKKMLLKIMLPIQSRRERINFLKFCNFLNRTRMMETKANFKWISFKLLYFMNIFLLMVFCCVSTSLLLASVYFCSSHTCFFVFNLYIYLLISLKWNEISVFFSHFLLSLLLQL